MGLGSRSGAYVSVRRSHTSSAHARRPAEHTHIDIKHDNIIAKHLKTNENTETCNEVTEDFNAVDPKEDNLLNSENKDGFLENLLEFEKIQQAKDPSER